VYRRRKSGRIASVWLPWMLGCGLREAAKGVVPGPDAGECQGLADTGLQGRAALSMAKRIRHDNADRWVDDLPRLIDAERALRAPWQQAS
jgi:hypothetical protein